MRSSSRPIVEHAIQSKDPDMSHKLRNVDTAIFLSIPVEAIQTSSKDGPTPRPRQFTKDKTAIVAPLASGDVKFRIITRMLAPLTAARAPEKMSTGKATLVAPGMPRFMCRISFINKAEIPIVSPINMGSNMRLDE